MTMYAKSIMEEETLSHKLWLSIPQTIFSACRHFSLLIEKMVAECGSRMSKKTGDSMSLSSSAPPEFSVAGFNISLNTYKTKYATGKTSRGTQYFNRYPKAPFIHCNWAALFLDFSWHFLPFVRFDQSSRYFAILWWMVAAPFESLQACVDAFPWRLSRG